jgi:hypothetical protein
MATNKHRTYSSVGFHIPSGVHMTHYICIHELLEKFVLKIQWETLTIPISRCSFLSQHLH